MSYVVIPLLVAAVGIPLVALGITQICSRIQTHDLEAQSPPTPRNVFLDPNKVNQDGSDTIYEILDLSQMYVFYSDCNDGRLTIVGNLHRIAAGRGSLRGR